MNLVQLHVTEIISEPYFEFDKWWVKVMAGAYGHASTYELMFETREQCNKVTIGYSFLA